MRTACSRRTIRSGLAIKITKVTRCEVTRYDFGGACRDDRDRGFGSCRSHRTFLTQATKLRDILPSARTSQAIDLM